MARGEAFATKLPRDLTDTLDDVCERFGLRKNFVVEQALREKLEDIMDTFDLQEAMKTASGFRSWREIKRGGKGSHS
ncbi:MAG: hypothetical protein V2A66_08670 [Pseudomonadota bacterium]